MFHNIIVMKLRVTTRVGRYQIVHCDYCQQRHFTNCIGIFNRSQHHVTITIRLCSINKDVIVSVIVSVVFVDIQLLYVLQYTLQYFAVFCLQ